MTPETETKLNTVKYSKTKAKRPYKLPDGTAVPGVTTILGVIAKPALIHWAWDCGMKGEDYRKARDNAADIGSLAHFLVECRLKGDVPLVDEFSPADLAKAGVCESKFMQFWSGHGMTLVHSELEIVDSSLQCGGKLDIIAHDRDGRVCLIDIKSSKGIYDEYWAQVAAYEQLWLLSQNTLIDRKIIVRIGKKDDEADFEIQERTNLTKHLNLFLAARELYQAQQELKK